jgi:DNA-binding NarL/FixJ family response regulator
VVLAGGVYVPPAALPELARSPNSERPRPADKADPHSAASTPKALELTERQLEVLALLMEGKNNKMIGRALDLAEPTVKSHVSAILRALNVGSRTEAVLAVSRLGWVPARPGQP